MYVQRMYVCMYVCMYVYTYYMYVCQSQVHSLPTTEDTDTSNFNTSRIFNNFKRKAKALA